MSFDKQFTSGTNQIKQDEKLKSIQSPISHNFAIPSNLVESKLIPSSTSLSHFPQTSIPFINYPLMQPFLSEGLETSHTTDFSKFPFPPRIPHFHNHEPYFDITSGHHKRKNATRETTSILKAWLNDHRKNPYPTKGEKIVLALITKMTLTQVSTWFANARRRLKKENKITWSSDNTTKSEIDENDDHDDDDDGILDDEFNKDCFNHKIIHNKDENNIEKPKIWSIADITSSESTINNKNVTNKDNSTNNNSSNFPTSTLVNDNSMNISQNYSAMYLMMLRKHREINMTNQLGGSSLIHNSSLHNNIHFSPPFPSFPIPQFQRFHSPVSK